MPRLPRTLHVVTTWRSPDNAIPTNTQQHASKVLRLPRTDGWSSPKCCACWENCNSSSENNAKVLRLPWEYHQVPRLPRETKLRYIWIHVEPSKVTAFAELNTGTAMRPSREHLRTVLRTVADGCGRLRSVWRTQPPNPQNETGTLATHSGKKPEGP